MRLVFVHYVVPDRGSAQDMHNYAQAARDAGHEVVLYGSANGSPFDYSVDVSASDALIFIFEWTTRLYYGDHLDLVRLVAGVPRERRVLIDGDGNYNEPISVGADRNHADEESSRRWTEICDSLSDKVCQPTFHPCRANVRPFLFYAYDPAWEVPFGVGRKEFGMTYVGHSKFRWEPMQQVLQAVEPVREYIGRIALVGHGWGSLPAWAAAMQIEDDYYSDPAYLAALGVEVLPAVPFGRVVEWMSKATFNPILLRPTFNRLRLVSDCCHSARPPD